MPVTEKFHIALKMRYLRNYIFDRIESVRDCYILHSCSLDNYFRLFGSTRLLEQIYGSVGKTELSKQLRSSHVYSFLSGMYFSDDKKQSGLNKSDIF